MTKKPTKRGRPPIGTRPMTSTERNRNRIDKLTAELEELRKFRIEAHEIIGFNHDVAERGNDKLKVEVWNLSSQMSHLVRDNNALWKLIQEVRALGYSQKVPAAIEAGIAKIQGRAP